MKSGFKTFALPDIAGCGPVLKAPHSALPTDTWLFNNVSLPIFQTSDMVAAGGDAAGPLTTAKLDLKFVTKFKEIYGALYSHLEAKGWAAHARAVFVDEPGTLSEKG